MQSLFRKLRDWFRRRKYCEGRTLSRFIARDIRRDIRIVSASRIDEGIVVACVRTVNVLYVSKGFVPLADFEPAVELVIADMWRWSGNAWGGFADGSSTTDSSSPVAPERDGS